MKKITNIDKKVYELLGSVSTFCGYDADKEYEAKLEINEAMNEIIKKYDGLNIKIPTVSNLDNSDWKSKDHFTKIFDDEIEYCKKEYGLTRKNISFIKELSPYLLWQVNMLVNSDGVPINQGQLSELLDINQKTVRNNMKELETKKCVFSIPCKNEVYYLVNPYLLYKGSKINIILPSLFTGIGYVPKCLNINT